MKTKLTWIIWTILFVSYIYMAGFVMSGASASLKSAADKPECAKPLDLYMGGFSIDDVNEQMTCLGTEGRAVYFGIETGQDFLYPMVYGLFFSLTLFMLARYLFESKWPRRILLWIPLVAWIFDMIENHHLVAILQKYPDFDPAHVASASMANQIKWPLGLISIALIVVFSIWALVKKMRSKA